MNLSKLALKNIAGSRFRSWVVALCALLVAAFVLSTTLIIRGAENSLRLANERLGADIVVVPQGAETSVESALLMGVPAEVWMPEEKTARIAEVPGVAQVSPQLFLSTLEDAVCCSAPSMFLVAYDPASDFTLRPWLEETVGDALKLGEAIGGTFVFTPELADNIMLYGYFVTLRANMEATGTGIDQSMFFTFDTAQDISRISLSRAEQPLEIPEDQISAVMVRVEEGADPHEVALDIVQQVEGVSPIESPNLFTTYRQQLTGLLKSVLLVLVITWVLAVLLIGLVFSMAAHERRRQLGVLRALGATRRFVMQTLLTEAGLLALAGGLLGVLIAVLTIYFLRRPIVNDLGIPFLFPALPSLLAQTAIGIGLALISVTLAALVPAYRISHEEPADAMRE
ncbi:MAG TPA: FtsX-like permease family protein [Anaerolineae bacterium]|jgi:putative ABC transport system permease protein|nr:FtsX-like permease family protein [Anaerolineae bacterium]